MQQDAKGGSGGGVTPNIGAAYEITVFNVDGTVKQVIKDDARCFVQNFLRTVLYWFGCPANNPASYVVSMRNLSGVMQNYDAKAPIKTGTNVQSGSFVADAGIGIITHGIVIGSGNTTVVADDYKLGAIIEHGSGSGQMDYDAVAFLPMAIVGNTITISVLRLMSNSGPTAVSVNEIGLYERAVFDNMSLMILRDVLTPTISLNPGEAMLVTY
jgi:hypothetical protein